MPCVPTLPEVGHCGWLITLALSLIAPLRGQTDGAQMWAFATMSSNVTGNILSSPAVAPDGTVYIGAEVGAINSPVTSGRLFALNPNGTSKWSGPVVVPDWIDSTPTTAPDGTIYFGCWDGNLYALRPDGTQKWKVPLGAYISAAAAIGADGTIYVGTGDGDLCAVNPDGSEKWRFPTLFWIDAAPAIAPDGTIYFGSLDNMFYAVNPDGSEKWRYTTGNDIASSPAIAADGTVYVGSRDLKLYAFTPSGSVKWTFTTTDMIDASPVLGADGTVYIATTGGRIFAVRPDGTQKWQYPAAGQTALSSLYSTPAVRGDGSLVFGTSDNFLYALKADGTLLWRSRVGDWTDSSVALAPDGTMYIGCTDKNLYAFTGTVQPSMTDWPQLLRDPRRTGIQPLGAASGTSGRLSNLSVRTMAGAADSTLIVGFLLSGTGSRNLLIRGVGPTLTNYGVSGVLADPFMKIIPLGQSTPTATNNNWGDTNGSAITAAGNAVGAFPMTTLDAAILGNFAMSGGGQTVHVSGNDGGTGIALVELYDTGGASTARLSNVSARSFVDVGGGVLIAGFVVAENTRAVLIRGIGPTLGSFGVSGPIAQPQLRLYNISNNQQFVVADNVGWTNATNASAIDATAKAVHAFDFTPGSKDSAMLLTLPPGNYSAQVSGVNSTTGNGMIEVYEVP